MAVFDQEIETLKREVSCAALLEQLAETWTLDKQESTRHALKYRRGAGEIIIVNHDQHGWWDPLSSAKGDVFSLVQHLDGSLNFGQVRQLLRRFIGVAPNFPATEHSPAPKSAQSTPAARWKDRKPLKAGSPGWVYLTATRRLPAEVLIRATEIDAVREGFRGSVWFGHRQDGVVSHVEVRGPTFKGSLKGGAKALFSLSSLGDQVINRLALTEAPIDALSLAAIEGMRPGTLYAATGGGMGGGTIAAIQQILADMAERGHGELACGTDANLVGHRYAERHAELARSAGMPFVRLLPEIGADWNDVLKGQGT